MNYYARYYRKLLRGAASSPRGFETNQVHNAVFSHFPGRVVRRPKDNPAIGFAEGLQFLAGVFDHDAIRAAAPHARLDLFTGQSAYGPRTAGQLDRVVEELGNDPDSRRAVMLIAHPDDTPETLPCTISMQFQTISQDKSPVQTLLTTINMRSSDAVWGLPYDLIQFGMVALVVANCLKMLPGIMMLNLGNAHVYKTTALEKPAFDDEWIFDMPVFRTVEAYRQWALAGVEARPTRERLEELFALRREERA